MTGLQTIQRAEPSTGDVKPLKQHLVDKQDPKGNPNLDREPEPGEVRDKTLCGEPWDVLNRPVAGQVCEECLDVVRARGQGNLIPAILAGRNK